MHIEMICKRIQDKRIADLHSTSFIGSKQIHLYIMVMRPCLIPYYLQCYYFISNNFSILNKTILIRNAKSITILFA